MVITLQNTLLLQLLLCREVVCACERTAVPSVQACCGGGYKYKPLAAAEEADRYVCMYVKIRRHQHTRGPVDYDRGHYPTKHTAATAAYVSRCVCVSALLTAARVCCTWGWVHV